MALHTREISCEENRGEGNKEEDEEVVGARGNRGQYNYKDEGCRKRNKESTG